MATKTTSETDFERIVREHKSTIYTVCYMFSNDQDEVNDLFQETLINLWRGFNKFEGRANIRTWIAHSPDQYVISFINARSDHAVTADAKEKVLARRFRMQAGRFNTDFSENVILCKMLMPCRNFPNDRQINQVIGLLFHIRNLSRRRYTIILFITFDYFICSSNFPVCILDDIFDYDFLDC